MKYMANFIQLLEWNVGAWSTMSSMDIWALLISQWSRFHKMTVQDFYTRHTTMIYYESVQPFLALCSSNFKVNYNDFDLWWWRDIRSNCQNESTNIKLLISYINEHISRLLHKDLNNILSIVQFYSHVFCKWLYIISFDRSWLWSEGRESAIDSLRSSLPNIEVRDKVGDWCTTIDISCVLL